MSDRRSLAARVAASLFRPHRAAAGDRVLLALSGGLDSVVLLHLLRFAPELSRLEVVAAHYDHRMRPESADDARWVDALAHAWRVPIEIGAAERAPASEARARTARYAWLYEARARSGARWILTAHHADDQAETVLFRIVRGTGLAGLRGIPARRGVLLRPFLGIWREELEAYARAHELEHRVDATNLDHGFARNLLRHRVIPELSRVAPGARRALVRLAHSAAREERAWRALVPRLVEEAVIERTEGRVVLAREVVIGWQDAVRARVLRGLARGLGVVLEEAGTHALIEFTRFGKSGGSVSLPDGVTLARDFDRLVIARGVVRDGDARDERALEIPAPSGPDGGPLSGRCHGEGEAEIGGRRVIARWSTAELSADHEARRPSSEKVASFALARVAFPLRIRGWRPGDRIRLPYGSKKLKKLLGEARVPASERGRVVVLVGADGRVLWVPGLAREAGGEPVPGEALLQIAIGDDDRA